MAKQKLAIGLNHEMLQRVKILAARGGSSINDWLAEQIELMVGDDEAYRLCPVASRLLHEDFHLDGQIRAARDDWHDR